LVTREKGRNPGDVFGQKAFPSKESREKTPVRQTSDGFGQTWHYVRKTFIRPGYRFWIANGDRKLGRYNHSRAENYHHPRHLMMNLMAVERLLQPNTDSQSRVERRQFPPGTA